MVVARFRFTFRLAEMRKAVALTAVEIPTLGRGDHADTNGLVLRVRARGGRSWAVRYSIAGRDVRFTIGKVKIKDTDKGLTLKQARNRALEILGQVAAGRDPQAEKIATRRAPRARVLTVRGLVETALPRLDVRPATRAEYQRLADVEIVPALGTRVASELTRREIRAWAEKKAKNAPYVANRAFALLRRLYSFGVERELLAASPFPYLKAPSREQASERVLSSDELWALRRALDQMPGTGSDVVRLLLLTGVRRAMALGARREEFEDLDGLDPRWVIPGGFHGRSKSKRAHVVPLSRAAVRLVLERMAAAAGAELFPAGEARNGRRARSSTKAWRSAYVSWLRKRVDRLLVEAGAEKAPRWTIHNLRQTIATHMREDLGVDVDVVSLVLGHAVGGGAAVTRVYDRAQLLKARRTALARWADWLEARPAPTPKVVPMRRAGDGRGTA